LGSDAEQQMTQTGMVIGTAAYLSPEQAQGEAVDARSDVYALGIVLYEMLTGDAPFSGDTPLAIAYKHVREMPEPPSAANPDVPSELDSVTMKALAKNPDNRYDTAAEMREDLERFLSGQKVTATPLMAASTTVAPAAGSSTQVMRETEIYPEDEPESRRAVWYVVIALLILGLFGLVAWLLANNLLGSAEIVRVPKVVGLEEDEAIAELEDAGFAVDVETGPSERREGVVFEQDPRARARLEEGETVTIFVSEGPEQVEVPDVVDLSIAEARAEIRAAGLKVGEVTPESSETVDEDDIIRQSPEAGTEIDAGDTVDLVVSTGPEAVRVPDVINQPQESAEAEITGAGLQVQVEFAPSDVDEGLVIDQDPAPGTEVEPGDTVVILVSEGPEEREMPDVSGENGDDAEAFLESDYGLVVTQEETACPGAFPPGTVCDQDPEPGTPVVEGDSATLFVQAGEASTGAGIGVALLFVFSGWA
jgi:serine/threonine-protein kinase